MSCLIIVENMIFNKGKQNYAAVFLTRFFKLYWRFALHLD